MKTAGVCSVASLAACLVAGSALAQVQLFEHDNYGGRDLYNGLCNLKQTVDGNQNKFTIRMGNAEPYVFVNRGADWEFANPYGAAQPARFKDMGHNAVFRWGDYRLEVDEDL
jgi:hypothetical protein